MIKWIKEHKYCLWLLYFCFYFPAFYLLEQYAVPKYILECSFDNKIPFIKEFIFPYYLWYITMPLSLLVFMVKDKAAFLRLCFIMFGGMTIATVVYTFWPNGINIRVPFEVNDLASAMVAKLQSIDPPVNVCPSVHVSSSVAIDMAVQRSALFRNNKPVRVISFVIMLLICVSTVFVKQHSVIDVFWGAVVSVALMIVYDHVLKRRSK